MNGFYKVLFLVISLSFSSFILSSESIERISLLDKEAPVKSFTLIDGKEFSLENNRYYLVVLMFFDLKCNHCVQAIEEIEQDRSSYEKENGYFLIGIGRGHSKEELLQWVSDNNIKMAIVADEDKTIYSQFADKGVPWFFLVDDKAVIQSSGLGWSQKVRKLLNRYFPLKEQKSPNKFSLPRPSKKTLGLDLATLGRS